ncbi:hypothetical protein Poli38472_006209 [Pythium oligandrum]|uniref:Uncharacterized protein n=1 Tax=Pythium oligandrum TaxID=41045 RepID=A0A8K1CU91_PYTOL|nr:hypothetical protein Poli38472_006209 [Pythium oligandrum]|eukprot:TMW68741.1 hypothetical protein Poli38472_006209 [Pythium oligandrum]
MNLEISTSNPPAHAAEYSNEYQATGPALPRLEGGMLSSALPQPSIMLKKENEPWRGSSGFGIANILNRNNNGVAPPLPKFSLPSLHSFGKPLMTKTDQSMNRPRSILHDTPMANDSHRSHSPNPSQSSPTSSTKETPRKVVPSRRIAPAPADDDDNDQEDQSMDSIRGGRWSADEHERFLAGFRIHGHKWKRVQQVVRTRSVTQVRTHAQKYLLKLAKMKAEKKGGDEDHAGSVNNSSDVEMSHAASSRVEESDEQSPRKKQRRYEPADQLDEEYIAAAATTLCFLMRQKIDSIFDTRYEDEKDLEPYDCYSAESSYGSEANAAEHSRKRPFMHFITNESADYSYNEHHQTQESNNFSLEGKQLCS